MRLLLIGDIHLSDRPPSVRTESYADDILGKLAFCVEYANQHADAIVLLGDVFHIKVPSRTSHRLVLRTAEVLEGFRNGRVLIVPGNHDLSQDRLDSLRSQPLGTLALSPNIDLIDGYDEQTGVVGIPYLDDFEIFHARLEGLEAEPITPTPILIATHASIFPPGEAPPYPHMTADEIETGGIPLAYGHIHDPHGFYLVNGTWFCNNGAISRGSLHEETVKRHPKITLFDSETPLDQCPFTSIDVPHKPAEEVFRLADHAEQVERQQRLDEFLGGVEDVSLTSLSLEEVVARAATSGLSARARSELAEIVESAVHG